MSAPVPPRGVRFFDWRHLADPKVFARDEEGVARAKFRNGKIVVRPAGTVDAITYHQTACVYGVSPSQARAAGGDKYLARNKRAMRIPAPLFTARDGTAIATAPLSWLLYHANALNTRSIGMENEGKYDGDENLGQVPEVQVEAIHFLTSWAVYIAREEYGYDIRFGFAHRQSHPTKTGDPGPELWLEGVVPAGLTLLPDEVFGVGEKRGHPIPPSWLRSP